MNNILFGKDNCPHCVILKNYLDEQGIEYEYVDATIPRNQILLQQYAPCVRSVPQLVSNGKLIGDTKAVMRAIGNGTLK